MPINVVNTRLFTDLCYRIDRQICLFSKPSYASVNTSHKVWPNTTSLSASILKKLHSLSAIKSIHVVQNSNTYAQLYNQVSSFILSVLLVYPSLFTSWSIHSPLDCQRRSGCYPLAQCYYSIQMLAYNYAPFFSDYLPLHCMAWSPQPSSSSFPETPEDYPN